MEWKKVEKTFISNGVEDTEAFGACLVRGTKNAVFALYGDLGAGKTALVRGAVAVLGDASASSPTFSILHEYETNPLVSHFDLYRLGGEEDLEAVGYFEALGKAGIVFLEWPDRAGAFLPKRRVNIRFETLMGEEGEKRKICIEDPYGLINSIKEQ